MRKAFTIVELMVVVAVIAILMGIIATAASQSVRGSRARRADALCALVQAGMNAYYAMYDEWPGPVGDKIRSGSIAPDSSSGDTYTFSGSEVRATVLELVKQTKAGNPVMDISGLFVSRSNGELSGASSGDAKGSSTSTARKGYGLDFMSAIHGTKWSQKKMTTSEMYFGYQDPDTGYFLRFKMQYSITADTMSVGRQR